MADYVITVLRVETRACDVPVSADSYDDACVQALNFAPNCDFLDGRYVEHSYKIDSDACKEAVPKDSAVGRRILAEFVPQMWDERGKYAVHVEPRGPVLFDVTDFILGMGRDRALRIKDDSCDTDALASLSSAPEWVRHWSGPFYVKVEDAIREYFQCP